MGQLALNDQRIVLAVLFVPWHGRWWLDVRADVPTVMEGAVVFRVGTTEYHGFVLRSGAEHGAYRARIVGGAGQWSKPLPKRSYGFASVRLKTVLADAAKESGEAVSLETDRDLGAYYTRPAGPAFGVLEGLPWYIDPAGVTQVRERAAGSVASSFAYIGARFDRGIVTVSTENPEDWIPGRTFESPQISQRTIGNVRHTFTAKKSRSDIWYREAAA